MMLSDLYGRIGQMLAEYGDAPIGTVKQNKYGEMTVEEAKKNGILVDVLFCPCCGAPIKQKFRIKTIECQKCGKAFVFDEEEAFEEFKINKL